MAREMQIRVEPGPVRMRHWAAHWLQSCREMPMRGRKVLDRRRSGPEKQIHDFRRVMKAWRALLKLAPPELVSEAETMRSRIGDLRRGFGTARDASVVTRTLSTILPGGDPESDARTAAEALLLEQRDAVRDELERLAGEMRNWSVATESGGFLVRAFKRSYRRARRRTPRDPRRISVKRLHAWRTAIVDLGYQLSFFQPADPARIERQAETAEHLRAHLGTVVDLDMVRTHLAHVTPKRSRKRAGRKIDRRIARQCRAAARIAGSLLEDRPKAVCAELAEAMARRRPQRIRLA